MQLNKDTKPNENYLWVKYTCLKIICIFFIDARDQITVAYSHSE